MKSTQILLEPTIKGMTWVAPRMIWLKDNVAFIISGVIALIIIIALVIFIKNRIKYGG